jgi:hypothetical protein
MGAAAVDVALPLKAGGIVVVVVDMELTVLSLAAKLIPVADKRLSSSGLVVVVVVVVVVSFWTPRVDVRVGEVVADGDEGKGEGEDDTAGGNDGDVSTTMVGENAGMGSLLASGDD